MNSIPCIGEPGGSSTSRVRRRRATDSAAAVAVMLLLLIVGGCNSVSDEDVILASGIVLKDQLETDYADVFDTWYRGVPWAEEETVQTRVDNEIMPAWAQDTYDMCVYWERAFVRESTVRQQGPDLVNRHTGTGWGWILMNRDLEFHILETGFQWVDYEADVAVQSGSEIVIDAWEEPVPDDTSD